jgi:hypothetical protein
MTCASGSPFWRVYALMYQRSRQASPGKAANALTHTFAPWYLLAEEEYQCYAEPPRPAQCHAFIDTFFHHGLPSTSFFITLGMSQSSCIFMSSFLVPTEESEHSNIERLEESFLHCLHIRCPNYLHSHPHPEHVTAETIQANTLPIGLDSRTSVRPSPLGNACVLVDFLGRSHVGELS